MAQTNQEEESPSPSPLLANLHKQGFLIIPSFLTPTELSTLRNAAANLTALARQGGNWPHIRTVGKQFPPWPSVAPPPEQGGGGIWGVQHLLHPSLPLSATDRAAFIRLYFSPRILAVVHELLQTGDEEDGGEEQLVMELLNMLVRPDKPFSLVWHRDDIPPSASPEEEVSRLTAAQSCRGGGSATAKYNHTQWNLPLFDDASLILVPGSHARARTEQERNADPYEAELPGQIRVDLKAGDMAFYDNDILHRGVYESGRERMTLHGSVSVARAGAGRARNVLQHGVGDWVDRCDFAAVLKEDRENRGLGNDGELGEEDERLVRVAEGMRDRLVRMGRESGDVGFSLSG
ncbi:phytanoyl-CoA dioxygenase [Rhypophila decipiens]|uniref:Phytanoyl-CoA dioxygenase n=1 Tax=Rhypophila decipiens TaxID=261697 RepID=A0AAN6YFN5_9PEZI|nr:phytanoyl-CoA dioxygenase [Rhypophila decipiens]